MLGILMGVKELSWMNVIGYDFAELTWFWPCSFFFFFFVNGVLSSSLECNEETEVSHDLGIDDDMVRMIHNAMGIPVNDHPLEHEKCDSLNDETQNFFKLLQDAGSALYPGFGKFIALTFIIRLLHMKVLYGWIGKSLAMLPELLQDAFPKETKLPISYYEAKKTNCRLGFYLQDLGCLP